MNIVLLFGSMPTASQSVATSITLWRISAGLVGAGGERVLVGDEEVAVVLVLQRQPVLDAADVVAEVELPGGRVAGEDARLGHGLILTLVVVDAVLNLLGGERLDLLSDDPLVAEGIFEPALTGAVELIFDGEDHLGPVFQHARRMVLMLAALVAQRELAAADRELGMDDFPSGVV